MKDIILIAKKLFEIESSAIMELSKRLDTSFVKAVDYIQKCQGRIIICGMGKSGLVGKKIVATLNSTGSPSYFLHPAEAIHGDLGLISKKDCFLSISNSGETDEILKILPYIKQLGIPHISLVGKKTSSLAKNAAIVLDIGVSAEGTSLEAVPMASTMAAMAMGDALAAALLAINDFNTADFSKLHLGGSLGHKLITKVVQVMQKKELPLCIPTASIKEVIIQMSNSVFGLVAIVDSDYKIKGIITDGDLRRALNKYLDASFFSLNAKDIMTLAPKNIKEDVSIWEAEKMMQKFKITALLVTKKDILVGIVGNNHIN